MFFNSKIKSLHQRRLSISPAIEHYQLPDGLSFTANPLENDILNSSPMIRLENIRQLGMAYKVYDGASHTRREHSLGAAVIATQMWDTLTEKYSEVLDINAEIETYYRQKVRLLLLLHDTGHAPGSHMFERAASAKGISFDHETETHKIIYGDEIQSIFQKHRFPFNDSIQPQLERIIGQIKDSVIDADKIDYLYRDAHHCGVDARFDRSRLIARLELTQQEDQLDIAIEDGGVNAFIEMILMRRRMFDSLYLNDRVSIYEYHLERFLSQVLEIDRLNLLAQQTDSHLQLTLHENPTQLDVQAILKKNPFKMVLKINRGMLKSEETFRAELEDKFGSQNILMLQSKIKPHDFDQKPFYVVDKKYPDRSLVELRPELTSYRTEEFFRIYVSPDIYQEARDYIQKYYRN